MRRRRHHPVDAATSRIRATTKRPNRDNNTGRDRQAQAVVVTHNRFSSSVTSPNKACTELIKASVPPAGREYDPRAQRWVIYSSRIEKLLDVLRAAGHRVVESGMTYGDAIAALREEWCRDPARRAGIEQEAQLVLHERDHAPAIAVHEVGHGLVAHLLGYTVSCISRVGGDCGVGGHAFIAGVDDRLALACCDNALIAAGGAALAGIAGLDPDRGCERDRQLVDDLKPAWDERVAAARDMLLGHEPTAMRLVAALRLRPRLDAAEFAAVVVGAA